MRTLKLACLAAALSLAASSTARAGFLEDMNKKANEASKQVNDSVNKKAGGVNKLQAVKSVGGMIARTSQLKVQVGDLLDKKASWEGSLAQAAQVKRDIIGPEVFGPAKAGEAWQSKYSPGVVASAMAAIKTNSADFGTEWSNLKTAAGAKPPDSLAPSMKKVHDAFADFLKAKEPKAAEKALNATHSALQELDQKVEAL